MAGNMAWPGRRVKERGRSALVLFEIGGPLRSSRRGRFVTANGRESLLARARRALPLLAQELLDSREFLQLWGARPMSWSRVYITYDGSALRSGAMDVRE